MGLQWSEVRRARRVHAFESQEQKLSSLTNAVDTNESKYITKKIVDHALELYKTISLPPGSPHATPTPPHYLSLGTP